ncbi:glycoside hydrolase family 16 protein [Boletus edulis BED1]|uniref:Glycoside hydrolase family 16 protein n=1 Tax=Boletus edulis BED1 TaxID=1328754 RepID=A0AAD4C6D0_BOLED|nr:glycoside hydrolase family 16 protein [Boletus edulis BED1]
MPQTPAELHASYSRSSLLATHRRANSGLSPQSRVQSFASISSLDSPYPVTRNSGIAIISNRFSLPPDPRQWGSSLYDDVKEPDDDLHNPDVRNVRNWPRFADRGIVNVGCLFLIIVGLVTLFAGYPIITYFTAEKLSNNGAFGLGGINASGQVPVIPGNWALIDIDTPKEAHTKPSWNGGPDMELVFSDEFNVPGRTFWPGDDPYWEAVDLHYWATNNLEWYSPDAITTQDGSLVVTLSQRQTHDLNYQGGMMSTWNKFCFTGGYIEANVSLPGVNNIVGFWPAIWTLGNLGRAGYGASLEGMWPYTYDACDIGTVANQSLNGQPVAATEGGDTGKGGVLSYLPGQRLSRCTCPGDAHPGPKHSDGTFVGRAAPEIDIFEAQITGTPLKGQVSQSAQWAPFNAGYIWQNTSANEVIANPTISVQNTYTGSVLQQATSVVTETNQLCYEGESGCYSIYGFEYVPGFDKAYITWISDNKVAWMLNVAGMAADPAAQISRRPVPQEPMHIVVNLGMSTNFGLVDLDHLPFPAHMRVDYIRVYQPSHARNIGCNPKDFPTAKYIDTYIEAYTNPNLTTWRGDYGQPFPKSRFLSEC